MESNLRVPGPTPLPQAVREAQAAPVVDHRGVEFADLLHEVAPAIASLIGTRSEVLLLTGSGTGAMEAAVVNTLSPGDRVLALTTGAFGDRFAAITEAFGGAVDRLAFEWGTAADPAVVRDHLASHPPYHAVLVTHNETSTGVTNPVRELLAQVRSAPGEPLTLVDGISGLGALPFEMDAWGADLVVSASQKAWMGSPGIAIAAISERARAAEGRATMPRYYWDFAQARRWAQRGQTPWTPAVSVLYGLRVGVRRLVAEGRERTWGRHASIAAAAQAGLEALGLTMLAKRGDRSNTVTAAWLPDGLEWSGFNAAMRARGLVVAGGQAAMAGRILRVGHMGEVSVDDITDAVRVMGETLAQLGHDNDTQAAVEAANHAFEQAGAAAVR